MDNESLPNQQSEPPPPQGPPRAPEVSVDGSLPMRPVPSGHKAKWIFGSFLAVGGLAVGVPIMLGLAILDSAQSDPSGGWGGLAVLYLAALVPILYGILLLICLGVAYARGAKTGTPTARYALVGGLIPAALVVIALAGFGVRQNAIDNANQAENDRAEAALVALLDELPPAFRSGDTADTNISHIPLKSVTTQCSVGTRWWSQRRIALGADAVEHLETLNSTLHDVGWTTQVRRSTDPLDTYEILEVVAANGEAIIESKTVLRPGSGYTALTYMVGPCVASRGIALAKSTREPGIALPATFVEPQFDGYSRTDLDPKWWQPQVLADRPSHGDCPDRTNLGLSGPLYRLTYDDTADPHREAVMFVADMKVSLDADGWITAMRSRRGSGAEETREVWAQKGESLIRLTAILNIRSNAHQYGPVASIRTTIAHGTCVSAIGFHLHSSGDPMKKPWREGWKHVADPYAFEPIPW